MPTTVTCPACGVARVVSDDELRARSVLACGCGNGSYTGINWTSFQPPPSEGSE